MVNPIVEIIVSIVANLIVWGLAIGVPVLLGYLVYRAIIGIIREVKKK